MELLTFEEYGDRVQDHYLKFSKRILKLLPQAHVEHIGSSSVRGLLSKGDLDIFVGISADNFTDALERIQSLGFRIKENTLRDESLCMLECTDSEEDVAVQLVESGSKYENFLDFRNVLRHSASLRDEYNKVKLSSCELGQEKYREMKSIFITRVLKDFEYRKIFDQKHFGGHLEAFANSKNFLLRPSGFIHPYLVKKDLELAHSFGLEHPRGWNYIVSPEKVRFANPLNLLYLKNINKLPNKSLYVVYAPSIILRILIRIVSFIVKPDKVIKSKSKFEKIYYQL